MDWITQNWELVLAVVGAILTVLVKGGVQWAVTLAGAMKIITAAAKEYGDNRITDLLTAKQGQGDALQRMAEIVETNGSKNLKGLIRAKAKEAGPLVQMLVSTVAAKADPKTERKPPSIAKRIGGMIFGNILTRVLTGGR